MSERCSVRNTWCLSLAVSRGGATSPREQAPQKLERPGGGFSPGASRGKQACPCFALSPVRPEEDV